MQVSFLFASSDVSWWDIFSPSYQLQFYCFWWLTKTRKNVFLNRLKETVLRKFMIHSWKEYGEIPIVAMVMNK